MGDGDAILDVKHDGLKPGVVFETVFESNPYAESKFRFRATRAGGRRAPKVVLCNDPRVQPGTPCRVRVVNLTKGETSDRGFIEVAYIGRVPFGSVEDFYVDPMVGAKVHTLVESGYNVLLDGPQGCGKTELSRRLAEALGMRYVFFNCASVFEATDFIATLQLRAASGGGVETVWVPTDILRGIEAASIDPTARVMIFLDEFNRCRDMARNGIMPALDSTRRYYNPLSGESMPIPPNIVWIAAINTGVEFSGASNLDVAQLDRFSPIRMTYPPPEHEIRLLRRRYPNVKPALVGRIVAAANAVRSSERQRLGLSVRATQEVCAMLECGPFEDMLEDPLPELMRTSFCGRLDGRPDDESSDAGIAWSAIVKSLGKTSR